MAFDDELFPTSISYGSSGGLVMNTDILRSDSGSEQRNQRWANGVHEFNVKPGVRTMDDAYAALSFLVARGGTTRTFRYRAHLDQSTAADGRGAPSATDELLGVGNGSNQVFQLVKRYGSTSYIWNITKPRAGQVLIALDGTPTAAFSFDPSTGEVTMDSAPGGGVVVTGGCLFDIECRFGESAAGGLFALLGTHEDYDDVSVDVPIVGVPSGFPLVEDVPMGDAAKYGPFTTTQSIQSSVIRVQSYAFTAGGQGVRLPVIDSFEPGGPHFIFQNYSGATDYALFDNAGGSLPNNTVKADNGKLVSVGYDSAGPTKTWELFGPN